jgi:hypothetical protein
MHKFEVRVYYRGLENHIVEAPTPAEAEELAEKSFKDGGKSLVTLGNEWERVDITRATLLKDEKTTLGE